MNKIANPWNEITLPPKITGMRSMLSDEEKQYLIWLTEEKYEGWGAVVDLGPWLGSSSAALAEGLRRQNRQDKVSSFDLFKWERSYMERVGREDLQDGEDFLPVFKRHIGEYAAWIEPRKQDLVNYRWEGGPIEILFVDAAKSWELTNAIFKGFGDSLIPHRSRIVLQDFRWPTTHWLALIFDSRPDLWEEIESVENGTTVTFVPLKSLHGSTGVHTDYSEAAFPPRATEQILKNRMTRETPCNRHWFQWILYRKHLIDGSVEEARKLREELLKDKSCVINPDELGNIEDVSPVLVPRGWEAYERGEYETSRMLAERCLNGSRERSIYALSLLGMSLLWLGDINGARNCIDEVVSRAPGFAHAKLYRAEVALVEGRYREAEADGLEVLKKSQEDEATIAYSLGLLEQAWTAEGRAEHAVEVLSSVIGSLRKSPTLLTYLAQEELKLGHREEALLNIKEALDRAPDHKLAVDLMTSIGEVRGF